MKEILEKISSYNIFNNLLPGIIFVLIAKYTTQYDFIQSEIITGLCLYYFIGLVISRIGSVIIEKILELVKLKKKRTEKEYCEYIEASKKDEKISLFLEINNMYRTFCAMGVVLLLLKLYEFCSEKIQLNNTITQIILIALLVILFCLSYLKQTNYSDKRIKASKRDN